MRVKLLKTMACPHGAGVSGDVVDLPPRLAVGLVAGGAGVALDPAPAEPETADVEPQGETAEASTDARRETAAATAAEKAEKAAADKAAKAAQKAAEKAAKDAAKRAAAESR